MLLKHSSLLCRCHQGKTSKRFAPLTRKQYAEALTFKRKMDKVAAAISLVRHLSSSPHVDPD
jgi:hypothetical protein